MYYGKAVGWQTPNCVGSNIVASGKTQSSCERLFKLQDPNVITSPTKNCIKNADIPCWPLTLFKYVKGSVATNCTQEWALGACRYLFVYLSVCSEDKAGNSFRLRSDFHP